ncbi:hypothetical protein K438DRAFT_2118182 [Mycena galopus ATCC 62051]|nr:hypothetical protein K438DRAFT_2118182 [Mycena galopus ATCC 62051]
MPSENGASGGIAGYRLGLGQARTYCNSTEYNNNLISIPGACARAHLLAPPPGRAPSLHLPALHANPRPSPVARPHRTTICRDHHHRQSPVTVHDRPASQKNQSTKRDTQSPRENQQKPQPQSIQPSDRENQMRVARDQRDVVVSGRADHVTMTHKALLGSDFRGVRRMRQVRKVEVC